MLELLCLSAALLSRPAGLARPPSVALPALPPQAAARALFAAPPPLLRREPRRQFTASAQLRRARSSELRMSEEAAKPPQFKLYPQRWVQLAYLALLAFLSDWVCFAVAAAPDTWEATFAHDPATLIDIFLLTNVLFCFLEPAIVRRLGLRKVVVGAAGVMATGCLLRSGLPLSDALPPYAEVVAGTVLVGAAQPFFQCTPPLLSATWFGSDERALATATAINFNQVGIATAFLVGGEMAATPDGLAGYFGLITAVSFIVAAGAFFQFQERPPTPPTGSAAARAAKQEEGNVEDAPNFLVTARELLATPGFIPPLVAFVASIGVSNVVSAFVEESLKGAGVADQGTIDLAGAGFQAAIVLGGIVLGGYVDRTKEFKKVTIYCLVGALLLLVPFGTSGSPEWLVLASLLGLGGLIGPVQPINAELAVEVSYPADENDVEALQQLCGNLFSALLVPIAERAATADLRVADAGPSVHGDTVLLGLITLGAFAVFSSFKPNLKRSALDSALDVDQITSPSQEGVVMSLAAPAEESVVDAAAEETAVGSRKPPSG